MTIRVLRPYPNNNNYNYCWCSEVPRVFTDSILHHETVSFGAPGPSIVDLHAMQSSQLLFRRASPRWQVQEEPPRCTGQNPVRTVADGIPSSWILADRIVQLPLGKTDGGPVPSANRGYRSGSALEQARNIGML